MTCAFKTLLPHPTGVELALEQDAAQKYCRADPAVIRTLFDPTECPAELLPWLAYALSVDVWNPQWPEATKRAVCANSLQMHLHKGTVGGVEDALEALGIRAEVVEWWQAEPVAAVGTMQVTLWVNEFLLPHADVLIGTEMINDLREQLDRSKRASIHYKLTLATEMTTGFRDGYSGETATLTRLETPATQIRITPRDTGFRDGYSGETATLTRLETPATQIRIAPRDTGYRDGYSGETATLTRMEWRDQ